jgi:citrate synthase
VLNPPRDSLTVIDNRTGQQYVVPIRNNAVMAVDVKKIKQGSDDPGLL